MSKQTKLSPAMLEVLRLMNSGWELAKGGGARDIRFWLQKGGTGRGGESKNISASTWIALCNRGLVIENKIKYPTTTYNLTPAGELSIDPSRAPRGDSEVTK